MVALVAHFQLYIIFCLCIFIDILPCSIETELPGLPELPNPPSLPLLRRARAWPERHRSRIARPRRGGDHQPAATRLHYRNPPPRPDEGGPATLLCSALAALAVVDIAEVAP
jgi:hypothetical protein